MREGPISPDPRIPRARFATPPRNIENQNGICGNTVFPIFGGLPPINNDILRTTGLTTPPRRNTDNQNEDNSPRKWENIIL